MIFGRLFGVLCTSLLVASSASATTVASTTTHDFNAGTFYPRYYQVGTHAGDYTYRSLFDLSDLSLTLDSSNNSARLSGSFEGLLQNRAGDSIGHSTAHLDISFYNLTFDPTVGDSVIALGLEGTSTSSGTYSFQLHFDNQPLEAETLDVFGGFATVNANHATLGDLAGAPFNFVLRENGQFDVWIKSLDGNHFTLSNDPFQLHGDIHGSANVPEPASVALLGAGMLFGVLRRKSLSV